MSQVCLDGEAREVLHKIQQQVDVVKQTAERISSSAEVYGAVQVTHIKIHLTSLGAQAKRLRSNYLISFFE